MGWLFSLKQRDRELHMLQVPISASNWETGNYTCWKSLYPQGTERLEIAHVGSSYIRLKLRDWKLHMLQVPISASNTEIWNYTIFRSLYPRKTDRKLHKLLSPYIFNVSKILNKNTFVNFLWYIFEKIILLKLNHPSKKRWITEKAGSSSNELHWGCAQFEFQSN
jgi:hypothetical protein